MLNLKNKPTTIVTLDDDDDMTGLKDDQHSTLQEKVINPSGNVAETSEILQYEKLLYEPFNIERSEINDQYFRETLQHISDYYAKILRSVTDNILTYKQSIINTYNTALQEKELLKAEIDENLGKFSEQLSKTY